MLRCDPETTVEAIYEAAACPELWDSVVMRLAEQASAAGGAIGSICSMDPPRADMFVVAGVDPSLLPTASRHLVHPLMRRAIHVVPVGVIGITDEVMPLRELEQTRFFAEFLRPAAFDHGAGCALLATPGQASFLCLFRSRRRGPFAEEERGRLQPFVVHLRRAVQIQARLARADLQCSAALEVLEQLESAILLVGETLRVSFANRAAREILSTADGLDLAGGQLVTAAAATTQELERLVRLAASTDGPEVTQPGGALTLPRPSGKPPLVALVAPIRLPPQVCLPGHPLAAVFLSDLESKLADPAQLLARLYGLTPAESRVAFQVASGEGLARVAQDLRIGVTTVRTHLARVLEKTGVRRQAGLTRLVERLCGRARLG